MITIYSENHKRRCNRTELYGGQLVPPFECPARVDYILSRLNEVGLGEIVQAEEFPLHHVLRVHDARFVDFLKTCWDEWQSRGYKGEAIPGVFPARGMQQHRIPDEIEAKLGYYAMAMETSISDGTWEAAKASADVALSAQSEIADGERAAFALCRPPGHHAARDLYGGYCFINNAAVCAQAFLDQGAGRVSILDVDFHHGNGTQTVFYDRDDVLFLSLHGDPKEAFPNYSGYADEAGCGQGQGFNANFPMGRNTPYSTWAEALRLACRRIGEYAPDALVVSLGVDTFEHDPISFFRLKSEDFSDYGATIAKLNLPTLFVMEGGYAVEEIGINTVNVLSGFEGA